MNGVGFLARQHQNHDDVVSERHRERDRHADRGLLALRPDAERNADQHEAQRGHREHEALVQLHLVDAQLPRRLVAQTLDVTAHPLVLDGPQVDVRELRLLPLPGLERADLPQHLEEAEVLGTLFVRRLLDDVLHRVDEPVRTRHRPVLLVHGIDGHLVEFEVDVRAALRDKRLVRGDHAVKLRIGIVEDHEVVEPVPLLVVEVELHLREVLDDSPGLQQAQARPDGHLGLQRPADFMPARHDLVVHPEPQERAREPEDERPLHHRQQVDAAGPHRGDLAVGRHPREDEDRAHEKRQRHRPLQRFREGHHAELADKRHRHAVHDVADDLDEKPDRQHEAQDQEREHEARQERPEDVSLDDLQNFSTK